MDGSPLSAPFSQYAVRELFFMSFHSFWDVKRSHTASAEEVLAFIFPQVLPQFELLKEKTSCRSISVYFSLCPLCGPAYLIVKEDDAEN